MRLITIDDLMDVSVAFRHRDLRFVLSRFQPAANKRTSINFEHVAPYYSHWWMIPEVRARWNRLVTGDPELPYEPYVLKSHFRDSLNLRMLSVGSGTGTHELQFARSGKLAEIRCIDLSWARIRECITRSRAEGFDNIRFEVGDALKMELPDSYFDIIHFNSSLHHCRSIDEFLGRKVFRALVPGGTLVVHDYVGPRRLQFSGNQLAAINRLLVTIPASLRSRSNLNRTKERVYGQGLIRTWLGDPSEAAESDRILPALHKYYNTVEETPIGGNILMLLLKNISHNFLDPDRETLALLNRLFEAEDQYMEKEPSDFVFGVYRKK